MGTITITSEEFNRDIGYAKKAAKAGPVIITKRGRREHVLLSIKEYERLIKDKKSIAELLAMPNADEIEFEPATLQGSSLKEVDFS